MQNNNKIFIVVLFFTTIKWNGLKNQQTYAKPIQNLLMIKI